MKIQLDNNTHWRSEHIRAFIRRLLPEERPDLCKRGAFGLKVKVSYTRRSGCGSSGYAYYHSNFIKIRLHRELPDKVDLAFVIAHELAHTRGMRHSSMRCNPQYRRMPRTREIYAWANELPLEKEVALPRTKPTVDKKMEHAKKMLRSAMTREKRAITLRKKWERKLKYYEKKVAPVEQIKELAASV